MKMAQWVVSGIGQPQATNWRTLTLVLGMMILFLSACGGDDEASPVSETPLASPTPVSKQATATPMLALETAAIDYTKLYPIKADIPGPCSYATMDQKDYTGQKLNILTHEFPVMGEPTALHAQQFETLTGAEVNLVHVPVGQLYSQTMESFENGEPAFDVMFYLSLWVGDFHPYLASVPPSYQTMDQMQDVTANYRDVATWNDEMLQFPIDGDRHALKYRTDVIENPDLQAQYKAATGKDLRTPQTWKEYDEIARFFNDWDWDNDGEVNYGAAEITSSEDLMFAALISRVAPYAKHPEVQGGFYFDLETMEPLVNTPGWVEGLKDFIAAQGHLPPDGDTFTLGDEIFSFGGGQTLFSYTWDDAFIQAMQPDSLIHNQVKMAPLPGAEKVWNRNTQQWDTFQEPNRAPYITFGWTAAVAKASPNQELAFDYLCFFSNPANHKSDLLVGRFGVNPFRTSDFDMDFWTTQADWSPPVAESILDTYAFMEGSNNRVFDLRIPGVQQYTSALAQGVAKAMAGEVAPQTALDGVADEWRRITESFGVENQRQAYSNVVKLEDNVSTR